MKSVPQTIGVAGDGVTASGVGFPLLDWLQGNHDTGMMLIAIVALVSGRALTLLALILEYLFKYLHYRAEKKNEPKPKL